MNSTSSSAAATASHHLRLPPGFRFHPTDEELVVHYLMKKAAAAPLPAAIIAEINLYKYDPWELPSKASFGEQEWYFFSPRERKYPNGERPNRAATSGYWKATGTDKPIMTCNGPHKIGVKKALVFYGGKPPRGVKTNWIMHEFRLVDNTIKPPAGLNPTKKNSSRLDDWVLCRIFKKKDSSNQPIDENMSISRPVLSVDGYRSPIQGRNWDLYSGGNINNNSNIGSGINSSPILAPMFSSHEWEGDDNDNDDDKINTGNSTSDKNSSLISLYNQNSSLVNYSTGEGDDGILNQSYQLLPNSQFEINH